MPELPETETIARDLQRELTGAAINRVTVAHVDVLRETSPAKLRRSVTGATITRCWRRAKLVVLDLSTGNRLVVQPRFTGALLIDTGALPDRERAYATITFHLDDGRDLLYRDIRRLGTVTLMSPGRWMRHESTLGVEPLDPGFTVTHLSGALRGSSLAVKKLLMDQRRIAGLGNIYANEALWRAEIDPSRAGRSIRAEEIDRLHAGIVSVLRESIAARGTSFRDYRDASGNRGAFAEQLDAYGRGGEPCHRCGGRLVATDAIDGRATVLCHRCQR
ncbi:MAG TPA: bifunctional DNA-formamidopyrimidine glycosylase/DNA-(apurinic or apyrimidinic site) lyase [Gemmatimonadaceae bacterium]|nr:bifunctional DNA-formamidopyrimidine glycosylase/DNA-(apurinic or apyrimidinic site) lyase [Gemmatimonadaceae bacterium]